MEHYELRVLADFLHTGAQAVNTWARPAPATVFGELEQDERGEVVYAEIFPPVTGLGVEEELRKVIVVLDGEEYSKYVTLSGIQATNMAPEKSLLFNNRLYSFGAPHSNNPLMNTTLKYKQNVTVYTQAGPTIAITQNYRVRLWGFVYKTNELPSVFGTMQFPAYMTERARNRQIVLNKAPIPVNGDSWLTLPGGKDQQIPKINPWAHYAYNLTATDGQQGDYQFRYDQATVLESEENMYWEFDALDALFIRGLGVKSAANLARTGVRISGDYHPKGPTTRQSLYPTTVGQNDLNFGRLFPYAPATHPYSAVVPPLPQPYMVWNEIGFVVVRDDGVGVVAANALTLAVTGIRIEMRS